MRIDVAIEALEKRGVAVALCCANENVARRLEKAEMAGTVSAPATASLAEAIQAVSRQVAGPTESPDDHDGSQRPSSH